MTRAVDVDPDPPHGSAFIHSGFAFIKQLDPDPHSEKLLDPDPQKMNADPQYLLLLSSCDPPRVAVAANPEEQRPHALCCLRGTAQPRPAQAMESQQSRQEAQKQCHSCNLQLKCQCNEI